MASDNFNRTNASPLDGNWAKPTSFVAFNLTSNSVINSSGGSDAGAYHTVSTVADSQVLLVTAGGRDGGPGIHMDSAGNGYVFNNNDAGNYYIFRLDAGSFTPIASPVPGTWASGNTLRLRRVGSTIVGSVNGTDVITSSTDNTHTGGAPGMHAFDGTIVFDDWTDGTGGGGGTTLSNINGKAISAISHFNGVTKATFNAIDGTAI